MQNLKTGFEQLVEEQKANIYSVCYMLADNVDDADDMFQEVLINLWKGYGTFRGDSSNATWTYRIALNTCISFNRKMSRHKVKTDIDPGIFSESTHVGAQTQMLHARIRRLDPFDRAVVLLWLEDISYEEIGAIIGISAKAVGVRLVRIREKLKKLTD